jgi:uncharacterized circularly permuted ATP-grasp superfamily protein/uncharacterized alpha-E superfamily protein
MQSSLTRNDAAAHAFPAGYAPLDRIPDELLTNESGVRPHWREYLRVLGELSADDLIRGRGQAARLIEENGVTFNVYGDPQGVNRPWTLDLVPQILSPDDWTSIETGLKQRAVLLDLVLSDLYGAQTLLNERRVPPEFIFANPAFLRPCRGLNAANDSYLQFYAADLTRNAAGQWTAISDRTQAPSGAGYALENRIVLSRVFPSIIHDCHVQRLASFFEQLRDRLRALAPHHRENPNIVLLTPGPFNETYFEHSYLARYLGFTLVEGEDLTVRDNCVYLKTLEGLERVDVIVRRLDDRFCDPLEFHSESTIGLVGLLQATHAGNVAVANSLGSGLIEAPALRAVLPGLCRALLGEELKLPSVRTWWCAIPEHLRYVKEHIGDLHIESAFPSRRPESVPIPSLQHTVREELIRRIEARPYAYVAHDPVEASTAPVWTGAAWQPRFMVLRSYAVAVDAGHYRVMPSGLTRFSETTTALALSNQRGGGSKDTWVIAQGPVDTTTLLPAPGQPIEIKRAVTNLPSRAADNLFWLGRYLERAEGTARRVRAVLIRLTDETSAIAEAEFTHVLRALAEGLTTHPESAARGTATRGQAIEDEIVSAVFDPQWPGSLQTTFAALHRVAWIVRDRLSVDAWRILNRVMEELPDTSAPGQPSRLGGVLLLLNQLVAGLAGFSGLTMENMTRGLGYRFLDMGRRAERSIHTLDLLRTCLATVGNAESPVLQIVLEISDSALTYRSRYGANLQTPAVLDLLLTDDSNPRSVVFQLDALDEHLSRLPRVRAYPFVSDEQRIIAHARGELRQTDIFHLGQASAAAERSNLLNLAVQLGNALPVFSESLARHYFSHTGIPRQLAATAPEL